MYLQTEKEYTIWQDENLLLSDWRDDFLADNPDMSEDEMYNAMIELNGVYLDDARANLSGITFNQPILAIADLGLWDGRYPGYMLIPSGKVSDCLYAERNTDSAAFYVDAKGEFCSRQHHHDGTNYVRYRGVRPFVTEAMLDSLCRDIAMGKNVSQRLARYTFRLGDLIGDVYGWNFPHRPKVEVA